MAVFQTFHGNTSVPVGLHQLQGRPFVMTEVTDGDGSDIAVVVGVIRYHWWQWRGENNTVSDDAGHSAARWRGNRNGRDRRPYVRRAGKHCPLANKGSTLSIGTPRALFTCSHQTAAISGKDAMKGMTKLFPRQSKYDYKLCT